MNILTKEEAMKVFVEPYQDLLTMGSLSDSFARVAYDVIENIYSENPTASGLMDLERLKDLIDKEEKKENTK